MSAQIPPPPVADETPDPALANAPAPVIPTTPPLPYDTYPTEPQGQPSCGRPHDGSK